MFRDGKWKPAIVVEKLNEQRSYNVKTENESMYRRNWKHLSKTGSAEDQTIKLSDDEDESKIAHIKSEDVANDEERIIEPEETKSEIRTRSGRISKRPNWLKDYKTF